MINFKTESKQTSIDLEEDRSPYQTGQKSQFVKLINNISRLVDRGHNPRHGIWNKSMTQDTSFVSI